VLSSSDSNYLPASVRSASRVLKLVDWLALKAYPVTLAETAAAFHLPKSSVRLLLMTLVQGGYAARDSDGCYKMIRLPGDTLGDPAWQFIVRVADPIVRDAVAETQESGFIAVMAGDRIRYLTKVLPNNREIFYDRNIDRERIPHQVASGFAILSMLPADELEHYLSRAHDPELSQDGVLTSLHEILASARRDGVIANFAGRNEGAAGAAAPVLDQDGRVIAAINISGPVERVKANLAAIKTAVAKAAQRTTRAVAELRRFQRRSE
jgi:DNA-binding IclR family transcriptional regulator